MTLKQPILLDDSDALPTDELHSKRSTDRLESIKRASSRLRDLEQQITDLNERLTELNKEKNALIFSAIPQALSDAGMRDFTLEREGNKPAWKISSEQKVTGNISTSWDNERRQRAFKALEEVQASNLIKTQVQVSFPGKERQEALKLIQHLKDRGLPVETKEDVNAATLKAWLRDRLKRKLPLPDLEAIGASVFHVAKVKELDDDD